MQGCLYRLHSRGIGFRRGWARGAGPRAREGVRLREGAGGPVQGQRTKDVGDMAWHRGGRVLLGIAALAGSLALGACGGPAALSGKEASPEDKEKLVAQRAEARWQALIKGDLDTAYTFLSPGSKAATSLALYKGKVKPGIWRQARASSVKCEGDVCNVTITIVYDVKRMKGIETQLAENWIIENGTPWYVYR